MSIIRLPFAMPNFETRLVYVNVVTVELAGEFIDSDLYRAQRRYPIQPY